MKQKIIYSQIANQVKYPFILPKLPYNINGFKPYLSAESFEYHYEKHHNTYVTNLNKLLKDHPLSSKTLEEIIIESYKDIKLINIFNNASQIWNHSFFWHCLSDKEESTPKGKLLSDIEKQFGNCNNFTQQFIDSGCSQFGSGWVWLVLDQNKLIILNTSNAQTPITSYKIPLLVCDLWEHAYYIDFRNKRINYLSDFMKYVVNWDFVSQNYFNACKNI